jgi:hypothetical protein
MLIKSAGMFEKIHTKIIYSKFYYGGGRVQGGRDIQAVPRMRLRDHSA